MSNNIIPFGKYRGRAIEEVLLVDPSYLQWGASQDWFRARFNVLHQVIINRGAEPEETPEHNALQVRFLEDDFCLKVAAAAGCDFTEQFQRNRQREITALGEMRDALTARA